MARPKNSDAEAPASMAPLKTTTPIPTEDELVIPMPANTVAPVAVKELAAPAPTSSHPGMTASEILKPGLCRICKGTDIRHVFPVDVSEWQNLGWQLAN